MNSSRSSAAVAAAGQQNVRAAPRGGLPRPRRPSSRPAPDSGVGGGSEAAWGRAGCSWWGTAGAGGQQAVAAPRRQACSSRGSGGRGRVPTGNRELVRRALSPPSATGGRGAALRRWSFRPTPSRLRDASCSFSSPASPRSS